MTYKTGEAPQVGDAVQIEGFVVSVDSGTVAVDTDTYGLLWIDPLRVSLIERAGPPCVTFEEALKAYRQGKRIRRKTWAEGVFAFVPKWDGVRRSDVLENDWQICD